APTTVTTDRGRQFESAQFISFCKTFGINRIRTISYHPASNGIVERFHRHLKAALRACHEPRNWFRNLPLVLLGIRSAYREDLKASVAELLFGQTLQLPGDFFTSQSRVAMDPADFTQQLKRVMQALQHTKPR